MALQRLYMPSTFGAHTKTTKSHVGTQTWRTVGYLTWGVASDTMELEKRAYLGCASLKRHVSLLGWWMCRLDGTVHRWMVGVKNLGGHLRHNGIGEVCTPWAWLLQVLQKEMAEHEVGEWVILSHHEFHRYQVLALGGPLASYCELSQMAPKKVKRSLGVYHFRI